MMQDHAVCLCLIDAWMATGRLVSFNPNAISILRYFNFRYLYQI